MKTINELQTQFLNNTYYKGIPTCKNPMDLWVYQEIIHEVQPDVIIEIGVWKGGSTQWLADNSNAYVIGIDLMEHLKEWEGLTISTDKKMTYFKGDATEIFDSIKEHIEFRQKVGVLCNKVMVIEDSSHAYDNTLKCLQLYSPLVSVGSYYIVEDTIAPELGYDLHPGLAVEDFLRDNDSFVVDRSREKYITWNKGGYLKRVK